MMEVGNTLGIDQSLNATGLVVLDEQANIILSETVRWDDDGLSQWQKIFGLATKLRAIVSAYRPRIVAMEDYARQAHSASLIPLVELGAVIKWVLLSEFGFTMGRNSLAMNQPTLVIQNQSNMKKFVLGKGDTTKDTSYLLKVMQKLGKAFIDDNQADAYMHAWKVRIVAGVIRGQIDIDNLPVHQQESLIGDKGAKKRKMTLAKAIKTLSATEKLELIEI